MPIRHSKKRSTKGKKSARRNVRPMMPQKGPVFRAFNQPNSGPNPIGAEGVIIGAELDSKSVFYYVVEKDGRYFYEDPQHKLHELPKVPVPGQGVLRALTQRGSILADIDPGDTGGTGGYCTLLSIENLND